jgi:hypothetical protein
MCGTIIGGCHTLANTDGVLVGDPLEKQSFESAKFKQASDGTRVSSGHGVSIT